MDLALTDSRRRFSASMIHRRRFCRAAAGVLLLHALIQMLCFSRIAHRRWAYILRVAEREACEAISAPPKTRSVPSPRGRSEQPDLHTAGGDTRGARVQVPKLNLAAVTVSSSNSSPRGRR
jgi:hypothetical protein